jgi:hypothetical protein
VRIHVLLWGILAVAPTTVLANEPPEIDHQASSCTVANEPISICAKITDDKEVARARVHFRRAGDKFYSYVEMSFTGLSYCGTIPAPLEGKVDKLEYYIQGIDNEYESSRTSTYQLEVKPAGGCDFPPLEKDPARKAAIKVYAESLDQGIHLAKGFAATGVTFVPVTTAKR